MFKNEGLQRQHIFLQKIGPHTPGVTQDDEEWLGLLADSTWWITQNCHKKRIGCAGQWWRTSKSES